MPELGTFNTAAIVDCLNTIASDDDLVRIQVTTFPKAGLAPSMSKQQKANQLVSHVGLQVDGVSRLCGAMAALLPRYSEFADAIGSPAIPQQEDTPPPPQPLTVAECDRLVMRCGVRPKHFPSNVEGVLRSQRFGDTVMLHMPNGDRISPMDLMASYEHIDGRPLVTGSLDPL